MIQEMYIKNFAIIEEIHCRFDEGMTVLTGETGAGKSIVIDAMGLLAGERASIDMIRYGADKSLIQGLFTVDSQELGQVLEEMGIDISDGQLLIQRELYPSGKSTCRVNGQVSTVSMLKQIGQYLIDIHGQNEHVLLLNPQKHLQLLDEFLGHDEDFLALQQHYQTIYQRYQTDLKEWKSLNQLEQSDMQRMDLLRYQIKEIEAARIQIGEEQSLQEEKRGFIFYQKIQQALGNTLALMQGEEFSAIDAIGQAGSELASIEDLDDRYRELSQQVSESYYQLQDAVSRISHLMDRAEYDEERLNEIEERLEIYYLLKRKYGNNDEEILTFVQQAKKELNRIENKDLLLQKCQEKLQVSKKEATESAEHLSNYRKAKAKELAKAIETELTSLYMSHARFSIQFDSLPEISDSGADQVEFYMMTNAGEPFKPLSKLASGGEVSRITLAMKTIFAKTQSIQTIVFDEVDTGVSGRIAQAMAQKMDRLAHFCQVLCITHLPQVSAMATYHYQIMKEEKAERTQTTLRLLQEEERVEEVARMMSGETITKLSMESARELIQLSQHFHETNQ